MTKQRRAPAERPRRVLLFVDRLDATGVVRNAVALARHLIGRGHDVRLLATTAGQLQDSLGTGLVIDHLLDGRFIPAGRKLRLYYALLPYRRYIRRFDPDVLISAGNHGHHVSALACRASPRCKTIFRISNDLEHAKGGKTPGPLWRLRRRRRMRLVIARASRLVLVSRHLLANPLLAAASEAGKVQVIANGVDVDAVRRRAREPLDHPWLAAGDRSTILAVGRFVAQKNFLNLLRALAIARRTRPVRLILIGNGPLRAQLLEESQRAGIADAVDLVEPVANPMPFLARASAVAIPSWWEGASNILLEALACGTPVVASTTAGNAEEVLDGGKYGLLVRPEDPQALAEALLAQTGDDPLLPGNRVDDFDLNVTLAQFGDLVEELAAADA